MTSKTTAGSNTEGIIQASATANGPARSQVVDAILEVAPDLSAADLAPGLDLRRDLGLDSIDLLNIASVLSERTGLEIPEAEYTSLNTLGDLVGFVEEQGKK